MALSCSWTDEELLELFGAHVVMDQCRLLSAGGCVAGGWSAASCGAP